MPARMVRALLLLLAQRVHGRHEWMRDGSVLKNIVNPEYTVDRDGTAIFPLDDHNIEHHGGMCVIMRVCDHECGSVRACAVCVCERECAVCVRENVRLPPFLRAAPIIRAAVWCVTPFDAPSSSEHSSYTLQI